MNPNQAVINDKNNLKVTQVVDNLEYEKIEVLQNSNLGDTLRPNSSPEMKSPEVYPPPENFEQ